MTVFALKSKFYQIWMGPGINLIFCFFWAIFGPILEGKKDKKSDFAKYHLKYYLKESSNKKMQENKLALKIHRNTCEPIRFWAIYVLSLFLTEPYATVLQCHILPLTGLNASVYTGLNAQKWMDGWKSLNAPQRWLWLITPTVHVKTKTKTYAIFSVSRGFKDIKYHILSSQPVNFSFSQTKF